MNTGGRRSPLGLLLSGLTCCAFLIVALSLGLGAGSAHSPVDALQAPSISSAVAADHPIARPSPPDPYVAPSAAAVLVVAFGFVLVRHRRVVPRPVRPVRRPSGRAPPGPLTHH